MLLASKLDIQAQSGYFGPNMLMYTRQVKCNRQILCV